MLNNFICVLYMTLFTTYQMSQLEVNKCEMIADIYICAVFFMHPFVEWLDNKQSLA